MIQKTFIVNNQHYYLYLEQGEFKITTKQNFNARIQDARKITTLQGFGDSNECMQYLHKYFDIIEL